MADGPDALRLQRAHLSDVYTRLAALVDPGRLGLADALELALLAESRLELSERAQHAEEALAGRRGGVDLLIGHLQCGALSLEGVRDVLEHAGCGPADRAWGPSGRRRAAGIAA